MFLCKEWIEVNDAEIYERSILEVSFNPYRQKQLFIIYLL